MQMTTGELLDRFSIEARKSLYGADNGEMLFAIVCEIQQTFGAVHGEVIRHSIWLGLLNSEIANLEWAIREAKDLSLEEVGRRALAIRDLNAKRVAAKNLICAALGEREAPLRFDKKAVKADEQAKHFQVPGHCVR